MRMFKVDRAERVRRNKADVGTRYREDLVVVEVYFKFLIG